MKISKPCYIFILIGFVSIGCGSYKKNLKETGNIENAIDNAIVIFSHTSPLVKKDSTFVINHKAINDEILGVSITGTVNNFLVVLEDSTKSIMPNKHKVYKGKLFYWTLGTTSDVSTLKELERFELIDTLNSFFEYELINDDSKKGIDYYFCKKNIKKYKQVKTTKAFGHYPIPFINCD